MGTVSVSTSLGEKFNITFTNGNSYDLDSIFDAKSRLSNKALVVEVKRNQVIAQKALRQLEADLTRNISDSLNRDDVIASVNDIITSVFNVYGRDSGSAPFAIQLIDSKITNYLQTTLNRSDIMFDITIYDNKANIQYVLPNDFIRGKFTEYYNKFNNNYSGAMNVSTGGLAISDKTEMFNMSSSDYSKYLYTEPSNNYYNTAHGSCSSNDVHWHQCGCDQTTQGDIGCQDFMTNPENIALINELKKVFLSKKSASEKLETKYIRADKGYFKKVYVDDDLVMKNISVTGSVAGSSVSGEKVLADELFVTSGKIDFSSIDGHLYEVILDKETGNLVLHSKIAGTDYNKLIASIDKDNSNSGHVYYNKETASFEVRHVDLTNYYTKEDIDDKIKDISANIDIKIGLEFADSLESITEPKIGTIYLIPDKNDAEEGKYVEYIYANNEFEPIGTTKINLEGYATEEWVRDQGYLTSIPEEYITDGELTDRVYTKSEVEALIDAVKTHVENTYVSNDVINNYATTEQVENKITEVEESVVEVVKEQVTEVISGKTSQVDAILYTDFDELEG